jgi:SAM-dependent methyltransferase
MDHPAGTFDVVTLWQVMEHMYDPSATIRRIHAILRPGGTLVIAVPNAASVQAMLFRSRWYHLEVPRHLFHFTPASLTSFVEREGFRVRAFEFRSREHNGAGILGSLMRLSPPNESLIHKVLRKTIVRVTTDALARVEERFRRGGTMTMIAEKATQ